MRARRSLLVFGCLLALAGCVPPPPPPPTFIGPPPNPNPPVPPPLTEVRPLPPVSEAQMVWRMGDWEWTGAGYVWQPGAWELLDGHSNQYLIGHWVANGTTWTWERGHFL